MARVERLVVMGLIACGSGLLGSGWTSTVLRNLSDDARVVSSRMAATDEYTEYVLDLLAPAGAVTAGRLFGGVGLSVASVQFAMIMDNSLYFVVDDATRPRYEAAGMQSFSYATKKGRVQVRRYFELPEDVLTDPDKLRIWAHEAMRIAELTTKPASRAKRKRRTRRAS